MRLKTDKRIKYDLNNPAIRQGLEIVAKHRYGKHSMNRVLRYFHQYKIQISQRSLYNLYQRALRESPDIKIIVKSQHKKRIHHDRLDTKKDNDALKQKPMLKTYKIGLAVDAHSGQRYSIYVKLNHNHRYYFYSNYQFSPINSY